MNKLPNNTYFLYRILYPGIWFSVLLVINLLVHDHDRFSNSFVGKQLIISISAISIIFGVIFHYLVEYPKRRKRFKKIEADNGPVDYIINRLKTNHNISKITKSKFYNFYFSILNDDIQQNTHERIYYFSSIYYLIYHVGFITYLYVIFNVFLFLLKSIFIIDGWFMYSVSINIYYPSLLQIIILLPFSYILTKKEGKGEKSLKVMFNIQTDWVERNWSSVEKKYTESFENSKIFN